MKSETSSFTVQLFDCAVACYRHWGGGHPGLGCYARQSVRAPLTLPPPCNPGAACNLPIPGHLSHTRRSRPFVFQGDLGFVRCTSLDGTFTGTGHYPDGDHVIGQSAWEFSRCRKLGYGYLPMATIVNFGDFDGGSGPTKPFHLKRIQPAQFDRILGWTRHSIAQVRTSQSNVSQADMPEYMEWKRVLHVRRQSPEYPLTIPTVVASGSQPIGRQPSISYGGYRDLDSTGLGLWLHPFLNQVPCSCLVPASSASAVCCDGGCSANRRILLNHFR